MMEQFRNMITEVVEQVVSTQVEKMQGKIMENIKNHLDSRSTTIPSSVGSSNSNSSISVQSRDPANTLSQKRKTYDHPVYANRTAADIKTYIANLAVPVSLTYVMRYLQLVRDSNTRLLSYEEFSALKTIVDGFQKSRAKYVKGQKGVCDDQYRSQLLRLVRCFDDLIFDPEYVLDMSYYFISNKLF